MRAGTIEPDRESLVSFLHAIAIVGNGTVSRFMSSGEGPGIEGSGTTRRPIFDPSAASASVSKDELKELRMRTEFLKGLQASKPGPSPLALTTILGYLSSLALYLKHTVMRPLDEALQADVSSVSSIQESSADDHSVSATDEQLPL